MNTSLSKILQRVAVVSTALLLASCFHNDGDSKVAAIQSLPVGQLHAVSSKDELEYFLKQGILKSYAPATEKVNYLSAEDVPGADGEAGSPSGGDTGGGYSGTYTLEKGVDEADVVKYTGSLLFVVDNGTSPFHCCVEVMTMAGIGGVSDPDSGTGGDGSGAGGESPAPVIRVLDTDTSLPSASERAVITPTLAEASQITGLYYHANTLVSIAGSARYGIFGDVWMMPAYWRSEATEISFFNASDANAITESWHASISGSMVASKRIDNILYLVTRYSPATPAVVYNESNDPTVTDQNKTLLDGISLEELLPVITDSTGSAPLFSPTDCYLSANNDTQMGYSVITTVTAIDITNPSNQKSLCFTGEVRGVYVSEGAIYFTYYDWAVDNTWVHKFGLQGLALEYRGSGKAAGSLGYRLESDFYLSEYQGDLRIITSSWNNRLVSTGVESIDDSIDHHLTVLRESAEGETLDVIAELPNTAHPEPLGKPNEHLYGVRFFGNRAYIVTFQTTDPLYVLDLSNPLAPFIAGELEVPGYSDFLHPVSENLLLGIGKDAVSMEGFALYQGLKLELFDVSDLANPKSAGTVLIGDRGTDSPALYNRHAFSYLEVDEDNHRFAIPVNRYEKEAGAGEWDYGAWQDSGLYLFEIGSVSVPSSATLTGAGSMLTQVKGVNGDYPSYSEARSVLHGNALFFIEGSDVWSSFWSSPETVHGPF